jgi:hypothetical protein
MHSCVLDLFSDRRPVSVFAQARGRGEREVLKLAKHDYLHIVVLMEIIVKTSRKAASPVPGSYSSGDRKRPKIVVVGRL